MIQLQIVIICFMLFCGLLIITKFIIEPIKISSVYKLYDIRDNLALLAMRQLVDEKSKEYIFLMWMINCEIAIRKDKDYNFSITNYLLEVVKPQTDQIEKLDIILDLIYNNDNLNEIMRQFYKISIKRYIREVRTFSIVMAVPLFIYIKIRKLCEIIKRKKLLINLHENSYNELIDDSKNYFDSFSQFAN